jgi:hypothetical protein
MINEGNEDGYTRLLRKDNMFILWSVEVMHQKKKWFNFPNWISIFLHVQTPVPCSHWASRFCWRIIITVTFSSKMIRCESWYVDTSKAPSFVVSEFSFLRQWIKTTARLGELSSWQKFQNVWRTEFDLEYLDDSDSGTKNFSTNSEYSGNHKTFEKIVLMSACGN